jgi:hypothetical protein
MRLQTKPMGRCQYRRTRAAIILVLAVVAIELLSFVPGDAVASPAHLLTPVSSSDPAPSTAGAVGSSALAGAESSLEAGQGPSQGVAWSCLVAVASGGSLQCGTANGSQTPPPPKTTTPSWSVQTYPTPPGRDLGNMVYDGKDGYVLLYGGVNSRYFDVTWKFSGGIWTNITPSKSPSTREYSEMAYDAEDGYVVLYGGESPTLKVLSDTWKFVRGVWSQLTPTTNPGPVYGGTMAYDAKDKYVVLFGGGNESAHVRSFTWEFKAGQWTKVTTSPAPTERWEASMDYDVADGYVVLFGGYNFTSGKWLGDTWTYTGGKWTQPTLSASPSARYGAGMAYSAIDQEVVLFGGLGTSSVYSDTWTFSAGVWTKISTAASPGRRYAFEVADGTATTPITFFGGVNPAYKQLNDTWTFQGHAWTHVTPAVPVARTEGSMVYDEKDGYVLLFGGDGSNNQGRLGDTWSFLDGVWTPIHTSVAPSPRYDASMGYDQADGYVVLFGGWSGSVDLDDTWSYAGGVWTEVQTGNVISGREGAMMTYDYADSYLLLFGGYNFTCACVFSDTWTYSAGVWTPVTPFTHPSARAWGEMTYDSEDGYVLLFSGVVALTLSYSPADTWSYLGGVWTNLTSQISGAPPGVSQGGLVDDLYDGYPVLWGGYNATTLTGSDQTWEYTGAGWTQLSPATSPNPVLEWEFEMAFDPLDNEVVLFTTSGTTWTY